MAKEVLTVRDVDKELWRRFRAKIEEDGLRTGQALNEAMGIWIKEREKRKSHLDPRNFLKVKGLVKAGRQVAWSEEIDKTLYGGEE